MSVANRGLGTLFAQGLKYLVGLLACLWMLFPIYWTLTTAFKTRESILDATPDLVPTLITFDHFQAIFSESVGIQQNVFNSTLVAVSSVGIGILVGVPAAYALSRMDVPRKTDVGFWILSTRMAPPLAILIPLVGFYFTVGIGQGLVGLTVTHLLITLPLIIWIVKGFIDELPDSLEESAMVDGCNRIQALRTVVFPLVAPGVAAAAFIAFIFSWNNYVLALYLTTGASSTLPIAVSNSVGTYSIQWGQLGAAVIVTILPPIVLSLLIRNYLVAGMTMGAVKG
jgi:multiple sugar transport system permease protein